MKKVLVYASILGLLLLAPISSGLAREEAMSVRFKNVSRFAVYIVIYDGVCGSRAYRGRLNPHDTASVSLCRGARKRAIAEIIDGRGRQLAYYEIIRRRTINLRLVDPRRERPGR